MTLGLFSFYSCLIFSFFLSFTGPATHEGVSVLWAYSRAFRFVGRGSLLSPGKESLLTGYPTLVFLTTFLLNVFFLESKKEVES